MESLPSLEFEQLKKVHIVGVCGTLMGAFAAFLRRRGVEVTGSDQNIYPPMSDVLKESGVKLLLGYDPSHLTDGGHKPDLVVIGNVVRADNPEAVGAREAGLPFVSLPEAMERLLLQKTRNLVVAGTHGKTTTASLLAHVLRSAGSDPNYFMGGVAHDLPYSFHVSSLVPRHPFVLEGDEYDTAFWDKVPKFNHYLPDDVILTSVEFDHADIYPDFTSVQNAFGGLIKRIRPGGRLLFCLDYPVILNLLDQATHATDTGLGFQVLAYGSKSAIQSVAAADVSRFGLRPFGATQVRFEGGRSFFSVTQDGRILDEIELQVPGHHNVLNALSVWVLCRELGIESGALRKALASFRGVRRRQEERGEERGVLVIDDFAHHPTAVRETLGALRYQHPARRLVAVFEPRSATSRRNIFQKAYEQAFQAADSIWVASPYDATRIPQAERFSSEQLVESLKTAGRDAFLMTDVDSGVSRLTEFSRPGDVVVVLSNGGFGGFIPKLLQALKH